MAGLHAFLKEETAPIHERLEKLPFFRALRDGSLPRAPIVNFLRSLSIIHAVLERSVSQTTAERVAKLGSQIMPKVPLLVADLELLDAQRLPSITPAIQSSLEFGAEILRDASNPLSLLGVLYVLEGSQNGGAVLKKTYARCLQVGPEQVAYFGCYAGATASKWHALVQSLDALALKDAEMQVVARSAIASFEWFERICAALYPYAAQNLAYHVAAINFEAGSHTMPQNPLEIELALRAGRKAWEAYPYLACRFGERGKRFTSSDSCWLVALTRLPVDEVTKNLKWLRTVLATRGLPTVILEGHLKEISLALRAELHRALDEASPFDRFLCELEAERARFGPAQAFVDLLEQFESLLGACPGFRLDGAAKLIASAWVDESAGVRGALAATQNWLADPARFSSAWVAQVNGMVTRLDALRDAAC